MTPDGGTGSAHLIVRVGGSLCALPADRVRRVVRNVSPHPVPGAEPPLLGLAQFGGEPMAVIDCGLLLDEVRSDGAAELVVAVRLTGGALVGLAVDEAVGMAQIDVRPGDEGRLVSGHSELGGRTVRVLDSDALGRRREEG